MRRIVAAALGLGIVVGFGACGKAPAICDIDNLTKNPQLCPDREGLGFSQEFHSGTFIGQKPVETLKLRNGGLGDLNLSGVTIAGDSAFYYTASWAIDGGVRGSGTFPAVAIKGGKTEFIQAEFTPTAAKQYTGTVTVASNAENFATKNFAVSGCGVPTDGGRSPCYGDGGP